MNESRNATKKAMTLTISRKLLLSYLAMALLTVVASTYAIVSLQNLNTLAYAIINQDFLLLDTTKRMIDALLAQESAEKKYLILRDASIAEIFWDRSSEFESDLRIVKKNQIPGLTSALSRITSLHEHHERLFRQEITLIEIKRYSEAAEISERESRQAIDGMLSDLRTTEKKVRENMDSRMEMIKVRGIEASRITVMLSLISLVAGFALALLITYGISRPLRKLEKATARIAEGKFDAELDIRRQDEIGRLANAFGVMTERLKILEAHNLDASPLTGLPGNIAIEEEIARRRAAKRSFALCHVDLDNFKPFADKYGYAWGSEIIKEVGNILAGHVRQGHGDGFVGHVGGDDFIIISEPGRAEAVCKQIVHRFDREIMKYYSEKDRHRGFIVGQDRMGKQQRFPLITITIAMVVDDGSRFANPLDMARRAAELKERAKTMPGSNFVSEEAS